MPNSEVHGTVQSRATWADAALVALVVLGGATIYKTAVALGALSVGPEPGRGPAGEGVVVAAALLALFVGAVASFANASRPRPDVGVVWPLLAPAAASFVVARFFTFDPYYAPTFRRSSEDGLVSPWWILALVTAALAVGALIRAKPRYGAILTCSLLVLCALIALAVRLGH